jgi:hypothetical protein
MGIIIMFVLMLMVVFTIVGAAIVYLIGHEVLLRYLHLPLSPKGLWLFICLAFGVVNVYCLVVLLNDSQGSTPDTSMIWKFLIGVSVVLSGLTCWVGSRFIKST